MYSSTFSNEEQQFCPKCGSTVVCRINMENIPKDRSLGINVPIHFHPIPVSQTNSSQARMLRDIDLDKLELVKMTGSEFGEKYQPPAFPPIEETEKKLGKNEGDGMKVYHGNCHCKAVTFSVLTKPLEEQEIMSCNCSSCSRACLPSPFPLHLLSHFQDPNFRTAADRKQNGDLFIYPKKNQVVIHTGKTQIIPYAFISKDSLHSFCKVCGVSIMVEVLSEDDVCPLNVRTLVDFPELEKAGKLKRTYYDGAKMDPQYKV